MRSVRLSLQAKARCSLVPIFGGGRLNAGRARPQYIRRQTASWRQVLPTYQGGSSCGVMDTFDHFQFDSASSYGGNGHVDDTSSIYATDADASSQSSWIPIESLENLSLIDNNANDRVLYARVIYEQPSPTDRGPMEHASNEVFDGVLDELPDDGQVELPPHACR